jgi:hypothetical protein
MESPPLTAEAIAFTEKKMDMTLGNAIWPNFFLFRDANNWCFSVDLTHVLFLCLFRGYNQDVKEKESWRQETSQAAGKHINLVYSILHLWTPCGSMLIIYPQFHYNRSKSTHSRMATLIKGMARFNGLWNLDQPLDKYVAMTFKLFFFCILCRVKFLMFSLCLGCSCTEKVKSWWKSVLCYKAGCEEGCCYANAQRGCPLEQAKVLINHCFFFSFLF